MTISTDTATASYTGNGTTQIFPIPFYFLVDTDIKVSQKVAATGVISVLTLNSDYTLAGAGNQAGGSATFVSAPASGDQIFVERNVDAVQETAYPENGIFPAASHERALDRLTMLVQQILSKLTFGLFRDPLAATYDVGGNTLSNVADAVNAQDVPSLAQTQALVAGAAGGLAPADIALFSSLASTATGKGSSLIGYKLNGVAGAVSRTLQDKWANLIDVKDFGAIGDGVTDDTASIQAATTYIAARGGCLYFPKGTYLLTGQITATYAAATQVSCRFYGESQATTTLKWTTAASGFLINMVSQTQSVHFADLSLTTTQQNQGTAIKVTQTDPLGLFAMSSFENITIRGYSNNLGVDWWARGVHMYDASGTSFVGVTIFGGGGTGTSGEGLKFEGSGTDAAHYSIYHNIDKSTFNSLGYGIIYATYAQGITASQCNFQNGYIGVWLPSGSVGHAQLNLNDNQFAVNNVSILMQSNIGTFTLRGNDIFTKNGADGISISGAVAYGSIIGNTLVNNGAKTNAGINISGGQKMTIDGNVIASMNVGLNLTSGASGCIVGAGNTFNVCNNDISSAAVNSIVYAAAPAISGSTTVTGGIIHKWGSASVTLDASGNGTLTYPAPFPNGYYAGVVNCGDASFSGSAAFSINHAACTASTLAFSVRPSPGAVGVRVNYQVNGH